MRQKADIKKEKITGDFSDKKPKKAMEQKTATNSDLERDNMSNVFQDFPLVDDHGKRYREFGLGCREYAPSLVTSAGTLPAGTVIKKSAPPEPPATHGKDCPFKGGLYPRCTEDCTFFVGDMCKLGTAQAGKWCPMPAHLTCGHSCMMYENGRCTLFCSRKETK